MTQPQNNHNTKQQLGLFLSRLFEDLDGYIEIRPFYEGHRGGMAYDARRFFPSLQELLSKSEAIFEWCAENSAGCFFGVLPRTNPGSAVKGEIGAGSVLWADFDTKDFASWQALDQHIEQLPAQPNVIVRSGGGYHCYWWLSEIYTAEELEGYCQQLTSGVGADSCYDQTRILRLPFSWHMKQPDSPKMTFFVKLDTSSSWSLPELLQHYPLQQQRLPKGKAKRKKPAAPAAPVKLKRVKPQLSDAVSRLMDRHSKVLCLFHGIGKTGGRDQSGSGYDYAFVRELLYHDIPAQQAADALAQRLVNRGKTKHREYVPRTVQKAADDLHSYKVIPFQQAEQYSSSTLTVDDVKELLHRYPDDHGTRALRGKIIKSLLNLETILERDPRYADNLQYNSFKNQHELDGKPFSKSILTRIRMYIVRHYGLQFSKDDIEDMVRVIAENNSYHPVQQHIKKCHKLWIRKGRPQLLKSWLYKYCGADPAVKIISDMGVNTIVAAVARVCSPGCEVHTILSLIGKQRSGKSSVFKALSYYDEKRGYFRDSQIRLTAGRDAYALLKGCWWYEWPEASALHSTNSDGAKAFISSASDTYRSAYGKFEEEVPRQCVIGLTVNRLELLTDPTGNLRYYTVETDFGDIDIPGLKQVRDLLYGEAYELFMQGHNWHFDHDQNDQLAEYQLKFSHVDTWQQKILEVLTSRDTPAELRDAMCDGIPMSTVLSDVMLIPAERQHKRVQMRMAAALQAAGFSKIARSQFDGDRQYLWKFIGLELAKESDS